MTLDDLDVYALRPLGVTAYLSYYLVFLLIFLGITLSWGTTVFLCVCVPVYIFYIALLLVWHLMHSLHFHHPMDYNAKRGLVIE